MADYRKSKGAMATHLPLLMRVFDISKGDVMEMGTGYFSTLVLHWLSTMHERKVVSYESNPRWINRAKKQESPFQEVRFVENWDMVPTDRRWGLIFIDHGPNSRRHIDIARFANLADYIVVHDTEPEADQHYHYSRVWPLFRFKKDYTKLKPNTTVVSNVFDLSNI